MTKRFFLFGYEILVTRKDDVAIQTSNMHGDLVPNKHSSADQPREKGQFAKPKLPTIHFDDIRVTNDFDLTKSLERKAS